MNLLEHFPYPEPRKIQAWAIQELEKHWDDYDVFVISAPTAFGKSALAKTLMNALKAVSLITPTNMLVDQFRTEFPDTCTLSRLDSYRCPEWQRPCSTTRGKLRQFCKGCPASKDLATAKYRKGPGIYNYHTYLSQKPVRDTLVIDEAHNLIPFIKERLSVTLWQHDYKYPLTMRTLDQMKAWLEKLPAAKKRHQKIGMLEDALYSSHPELVPTRGKEQFAGKGTFRGEPETRDCLKLLPVNISGAAPFFWPKEVEKLVLMSATLSDRDIRTLGLDRKRVLYIDCESPIPADRRPIIVDPIARLNHASLVPGTLLIANHILKVLAPRHEKQKGLIHATYQQSSILAGVLGTQSRFMFHDSGNRSLVYKRFRDSPAEEGRVLIACGMHEGVDLPEDLGRWQVIAKIPWGNLGNPAVRYQQEKDPGQYHWETWRTVIQACGRICRTPEDQGVTYICDGSINRLLQEAGEMPPAWFTDALIHST